MRDWGKGAHELERFREGAGGEEPRRVTGTEWAWRPACSLVFSQAPWVAVRSELLLEPDLQDFPSVKLSLVPKERLHQRTSYSKDSYRALLFAGNSRQWQ